MTTIDGRCGSCRSWRHLGEGWGECGLSRIDRQGRPLDSGTDAIVAGYGPVIVASAGIGELTEAFLMTNARFGCVQHEARRAEQEAVTA